MTAAINPDGINSSSLSPSLPPSFCPSLPSSRCELGQVSPYSPVFYGGWRPEAVREDGQLWEDPVESEHEHEALRAKQEVRPGE